MAIALQKELEGIVEATMKMPYTFFVVCRVMYTICEASNLSSLEA